MPPCRGGRRPPPRAHAMHPYDLTVCRRYTRGLAPNSARKAWLKFELKKANQLRLEEHKRPARRGGRRLPPQGAYHAPLRSDRLSAIRVGARAQFRAERMVEV